MDRQPRNAFVASSNAQRLALDLLADLAKVEEALVDVEELAVLLRRVGRRRWEGEVRVGVGRVGLRRRSRRERGGRVDQLEDERASGDNALSSREEVATNDTVGVHLSMSLA